MKNKGVLFLIGILLLVGIVLAAHTLIITFDSTPNGPTNKSLYESTSSLYDIYVKSSVNQIIQINLSIPQNFTFNTISPSIGYCSNSIIQGNIVINCSNSPSSLILYQLNLSANLININTNFNLSIITKDVIGDLNSSNLTITILNDSIPPLLSNPNPSSGAIIKNQSYIFNISITELESGLLDSLIKWDFESNYSVWSATILNQSMICTSNFCNALIDLTNPATNYIFYEITTRDNALNSVSLMRFIAIDQYPSIINLTSPAGIITNGQEFGLNFSSSDNSFDFDAQLNRTLRCEIYIDSILNNYSYTNVATTQTLNLNITGLVDGGHSWYASCIDKAEYISITGTSNFTLDTNGPSISLLAPPNSSVISNITQINLNISDQYSGINSIIIIGNGVLPVSNVSSQYNFSIFNAIGGENIINIFANDSLNNINSKNFTFTVDNSTPVLNPITGNGAYSGTSSSISFTINDTYSNILTCNLLIANETRTIITNNSGTFTFSDINLLNGTYIWNITCIDQGDNRISSPNNELNVDGIAPTINLITPYNNNNSLTSAIQFNYTIYDSSLINNCSLYINDIKNNTNSTEIINDGNTNNSINSMVLASNSAYNWTVSCYDIYNNKGTPANIKVYYDNIGPTISSIQSSADTSSAIINWTIDEPASSILYYWPTTNLSDIQNKTIAYTAVILQPINLASLTSSTTYNYNITSTDYWGNSLNSSIKSFTTATPASPTGDSGPGGRGGGSCDPNWQTGSWSKCSSNGIQTRTVTDLNDCREDENKPITSQSCIYLECKSNSDCLSGYECKSNKCTKIPEVIPTETPTEEITPPLVTGFAILDNIKANPKLAAILSILILAIILGSYYWLKSGDIPKDKVREVISKGKINQE